MQTNIGHFFDCDSQPFKRRRTGAVTGSRLRETRWPGTSQDRPALRAGHHAGADSYPVLMKSTVFTLGGLGGLAVSAGIAWLLKISVIGLPVNTPWDYALGALIVICADRAGCWCCPRHARNPAECGRCATRRISCEGCFTKAQSAIAALCSNPKWIDALP